MNIAQRVKMAPPRLAEIFMGTGIESFPGMAGRLFCKPLRRPAAKHDRAFIFDLAMCLLCFCVGLRDTDDAGGDAQVLCRKQRVLRTLAQIFIAMERVTAYRQVVNESNKWTQPILSVSRGDRPIRIGNDANGKTHVGRFFNGFYQDGVVDKRLASFKIDRGDAGIFRLRQDLYDPFECECPRLPRTAPYEAMVAFISALIGK